jgi:hypothetical protein
VPVPEMGQQMPPPSPRRDDDFESLVPLPELPELLRPERPAGSDQAARANGRAKTAAPGRGGDPDAADTDAADTDLDMEQARRDAV